MANFHVAIPIGELRAVLEDILSNGLEGGGEGELGQRAAAEEGGILNFRDPVRNGNGGETRSAGERTFPNGAH